MTLEELTRAALVAYANHRGMEPMRAAILAVLAEVRKECVPEEAPHRWHETAHDEGNDDGWNDCRAEMLRRLDEMEGGE